MFDSERKWLNSITLPINTCHELKWNGSYLTLKSLSLMFSTQCAAVTTQLGLNNEPPQKGPLVISIACHGHELGAAWYPPTIRERGRTPHPS